MIQHAFTGDLAQQPIFLRLLRALDLDIFETLQFTVLHKIILGLVHIDIQNYLAATSEEINVPDSAGQTPLYWAATRGDNDAVEALLRHGADPNYVSKLGETPLFWSVEAKDNTCTKLLLKYGANPSHKTRYGTTPLHYAVWPHADPGLQVEPLLAAGAAVNVKNKRGMTALHYAIWNDMIGPAHALLRNNASLEVADNNGHTPLLTAMVNNRVDSVRYLLEVGANPKARSKTNETILHIAAAEGELEMFSVIESKLSQTLDCEARNDSGETPMDIIIKRPSRTPELVSVFEKLLSQIRNWITEVKSDESSSSSSDQYSTPPE
jgi:ankyrin repeat protein